MDATGVGAPVVDLLRNANLDCTLTPITITGNGKWSPVNGTVPRAELLTHLQLVIQQNEIEITQSCSQTEALRHLKLDCTIRGQHDEIGMALALAAWSLKRGHVEMFAIRRAGLRGTSVPPAQTPISRTRAKLQ